ncbi:MAG: Maf family protein [Terriglobales bacterium]
MMPPLVCLASASPRRRELLQAAGWQVQVHPADVDETRLPDEDPAHYVLRLARAKAAAIAPSVHDSPVLGADTVVVLGDQLFGKPRDDAHARAMLTQLAARTHQVLTGVCLRLGSRECSGLDITAVTFGPLSATDLDAYIATGEPGGKAGAYAIQGRAACFIPRIEGSYSNVVGLPLALVWCLWRQLQAS